MAITQLSSWVARTIFSSSPPGPMDRFTQVSTGAPVARITGGHGPSTAASTPPTRLASWPSTPIATIALPHPDYPDHSGRRSAMDRIGILRHNPLCLSSRHIRCKKRGSRDRTQGWVRPRHMSRSLLQWVMHEGNHAKIAWFWHEPSVRPAAGSDRVAGRRRCRAATSGVEASAIHHRATSRRPSCRVAQEWSRYLMAGPTVWAEVVHPPVTPAVESAVWKDIKTDPGRDRPDDRLPALEAEPSTRPGSPTTIPSSRRHCTDLAGEVVDDDDAGDRAHDGLGRDDVATIDDPRRLRPPSRRTWSRAQSRSRARC